jgi:hypothetical protein
MLFRKKFYTRGCLDAIVNQTNLIKRKKLKAAEKEVKGDGFK